MSKKTPSLRGKAKGILLFLVFVSVVIILAMIAQITPVAEWISKTTGVATDKVKSIARTVVSGALGVALVGWGIASLAVPILGVAMILIGLVLIGLAVYPLFTSSQTKTVEQGTYGTEGPLRVFGN